MSASGQSATPANGESVPFDATWQPISTALRDRTEFLAYRPMAHLTTILRSRWSAAERIREHRHRALSITPTVGVVPRNRHWQLKAVHAAYASVLTLLAVLSVWAVMP